jgi:hypothetical protein
MASEADTLRAERDELLAIVRECQGVLAMLTVPKQISGSTLLNAWAACVAAETRARQALQGLPHPGTDPDPPNQG